jgi:hypothetical protein
MQWLMRARASLADTVPSEPDSSAERKRLQ